MFGKSLIRRNDPDSFREVGRPFASLQREMNRLFDDFFSDSFGLGPWTGRDAFSPRMNVSETDSEVRIEAEVPGVDEKDIDVSVTRSSLTIKGEKRETQEKKAESFHHVESSYGAFERTLPLPAEIETDKVEAKFSKGVLTVTLPKTKEARDQARHVKVKAQ